MSEEQTPRGPAPDGGGEREGEQTRLMVTRREFLIGAGAGVAVTAAAAGAVSVLSPPAPEAVAPAPAAPGAPAVAPAPEPGAPAVVLDELPLTLRQVTLNIDGTEHQVLVDVRESLWETMTYKLGTGVANLGCDRAQCGACMVTVDGRAVNGCTVLTARLGRGQQVLTAAGLATGPGIAGLHPIQRAFWQQGGFQCGMCTRGFIMSTYSLLQVNNNPTRDQIREGLAGNICRCGEYVKMYKAVEAAAAEMRA